MDTKTLKIRMLNDMLRITGVGNGGTFCSNLVANLPDEDRAAVILKTVTFNNFNEDNDPHNEHDFGSFEHKGTAYFWKIDYYDNDCLYGSEDPSKPESTYRKLTIMQASEY